jgi:hypothetical protein
MFLHQLFQFFFFFSPCQNFPGLLYDMSDALLDLDIDLNTGP